jgi:hypothetical protein
MDCSLANLLLYLVSPTPRKTGQERLLDCSLGVYHSAPTADNPAWSKRPRPPTFPRPSKLRCWCVGELGASSEHRACAIRVGDATVLRKIS